MLRAKGKEKQGKVWRTIAGRFREKRYNEAGIYLTESAKLSARVNRPGHGRAGGWSLVLSGLFCLPLPVRIPTHGIFLYNSPPRQTLLFRRCLQVIFVGPFSCSIETIRKKVRRVFRIECEWQRGKERLNGVEDR